MRADAFQIRRQRFIICENSPAVSIAAQWLGGEKTRRCGQSEGANFAATLTCAEALSRVGENEKPIVLRECKNRLVVGWHTEQIGNDNSFRDMAGIPRCAHRRGKSVGVKSEGVLV